MMFKKPFKARKVYIAAMLDRFLPQLPTTRDLILTLPPVTKTIHP